MSQKVIQFILPVALKDVFDMIAPTFMAETGYRFELAIMLNPQVPGYIAQGNAWSIAASNPRYIEEIAALGACDPDVHSLGYSPLSLAMLGESHDLPADTTSDIAKTLMSAQSIAITDGGTSGSQFDALLSKLGVADVVQPKVRCLPGGGPMAALLSGKVDLAALPQTNVAPVKGVRSAALCPRDLGVHIDLACCIHKDANTATHTFADWLLDRARRDAFETLGLVKWDR